MGEALPEFALSVRQPWAWAIIHAGKDVENRTPFALRHLTRRGWAGVHASKGMTQREYEDARDFMASLGIDCPAAIDLPRGCLVGSVYVVGSVKALKYSSPWLSCSHGSGLVLRDARPCKFVQCNGQLGFFRPRPEPVDVAIPKWMLAAAQSAGGNGERGEIENLSLPGLRA